MLLSCYAWRWIVLEQGQSTEHRHLARCDNLRAYAYLRYISVLRHIFLIALNLLSSVAVPFNKGIAYVTHFSTVTPMCTNVQNLGDIYRNHKFTKTTV
jgi:hypothetical protein